MRWLGYGGDENVLWEKERRSSSWSPLDNCGWWLFIEFGEKIGLERERKGCSKICQFELFLVFVKYLII